MAKRCSPTEDVLYGIMDSITRARASANNAALEAHAANEAVVAAFKEVKLLIEERDALKRSLQGQKHYYTRKMKKGK